LSGTERVNELDKYAKRPTPENDPGWRCYHCRGGNRLFESPPPVLQFYAGEHPDLVFLNNEYPEEDVYICATCIADLIVDGTLVLVPRATMEEFAATLPSGLLGDVVEVDDDGSMTIGETQVVWH